MFEQTPATCDKHVLTQVIMHFTSFQKFSTGRWIKIWAPTQNGRKVWLKVQCLVIWYPIENLIHSRKSFYWNSEEPGPKLIKVNIICTNEAGFLVGYLMTRFSTLCHTCTFCHFVLTLKLSEGRCSALNWLPRKMTPESFENLFKWIRSYSNIFQ